VLWSWQKILPSHFCLFIILFYFVSLSSLIFTFNFKIYSFPQADKTLPSYQYVLEMHIESKILSRGHELMTSKKKGKKVAKNPPPCSQSTLDPSSFQVIGLTQDFDDENTTVKHKHQRRNAEFDNIKIFFSESYQHSIFHVSAGHHFRII